MKRLLFLLPLVFLAIFFFYPLASITARGLAPRGALDLSAFGKIAGSEFYRETLWFTFWQAAVSTVLTIIAAFPAAYVMARYDFRGKSFISALTLLPFVMPTVIVAAGFMALIGPRGWVNEALKALLNVDYAPLDIQNTIWIILLAHVFYNFAVALRLISGFWSNLDPQTDAGRARVGSRPLARLPRSDAAVITPRDPRGSAAGLHLRLHLVRRDLDPGRPAVQHDRNRHLSQDADRFRSAPGDRLGPGAVGLHLCHDHHLHAAAKSRRGAARSASAPDHAAATGHAPRQGAAADRDDLDVEFVAAAAGRR